MNTRLVSLVIPVYNERESLPALLSSLPAALKGVPHEIVLVDDGSTDGSAGEIERFARENSNVRGVLLTRNFGQTAALAAGFKEARGEVIVPLDADGQNDPADIPRLLEPLTRGYDVVSGWRRSRKDPFLSRKLPSFLANAVISAVTGVRLHDFGCTLKAYRRSVLQSVQLYGEMHRFLPAWCAWRGAKVTEMEVRHNPRLQGRSKYGIGRTFKVILDLLTTKFFSGYITKPSYVFGGLGMIFMGIGFLSATVAFYDKLGPDRWGALRIPLLLLSAFLGMIATLLVLMGLLAELVVRVYYRASGEEPYEVLRIVGTEPAARS